MRNLPFLPGRQDVRSQCSWPVDRGLLHTLPQQHPSLHHKQIDSLIYSHRQDAIHLDYSQSTERERWAQRTLNFDDLTEIGGIVVTGTKKILWLKEWDQRRNGSLVHARTIGHNVEVIKHVQQPRRWLMDRCHHLSLLPCRVKNKNKRSIRRSNCVIMSINCQVKYRAATASDFA